MPNDSRRAELVRTLANLHPPQLTTLKALVNFPAAYQPGPAAPSAEHAVALVNWAESAGGCGLVAVQNAMNQVPTFGVETGPPPGMQNAAVNDVREQVVVIQNGHGNVTGGQGRNRLGVALAGLMIVSVALGAYWSFQKRKPELYRLRVTAVNAQTRLPMNEAKVTSSFGGEPKRVEGGWQFDIPAAGSPRDGKLTVFAENEERLLRGECEVRLGDEPNPAAVIELVKTPLRIGGVIVDERNRGVAGATVVAVEASRPAAASGADGSFEVWVTPKTKTDPVRVRAEKDGYAPDEEYFRAGQGDAKLVLKWNRGTKGNR